MTIDVFSRVLKGIPGTGNWTDIPPPKERPMRHRIALLVAAFSLFVLSDSGVATASCSKSQHGVARLLGDMAIGPGGPRQVRMRCRGVPSLYRLPSP